MCVTIYCSILRQRATERDTCRFSWPEACAQLDLAVEDSRKQKRRGTPNAIVLAGMSMPDPFDTPVQMPKGHVRMLHQLRREVRERAGLPPLVPEVKDEGGEFLHPRTHCFSICAAEHRCVLFSKSCNRGFRDTTCTSLCSGL